MSTPNVFTSRHSPVRKQHAIIQRIVSLTSGGNLHTRTPPLILAGLLMIPSDWSSIRQNERVNPGIFYASCSICITMPTMNWPIDALWLMHWACNFWLQPYGSANLHCGLRASQDQLTESYHVRLSRQLPLLPAGATGALTVLKKCVFSSLNALPKTDIRPLRCLVHIIWASLALELTLSIEISHCSDLSDVSIEYIELKLKSLTTQ